MDISYNYLPAGKFIPEGKLEEEKQKKLIEGYAGKLLQLCDARIILLGVDNDDHPFVYVSGDRLVDAFSFDLEAY